MTARQDALGRPLNPDTGLPYPSASTAQEQLADELITRLLGDLFVIRDSTQIEAVRDALVEAVVRQHGRTLRACLGELRDYANAIDEEARDKIAEATEGPRVASDLLAIASRHANEARALRNAQLFGWQA